MAAKFLRYTVTGESLLSLVDMYSFYLRWAVALFLGTTKLMFACGEIHKQQ